MSHPVQEITVRVGGAYYQLRTDMSPDEVNRIVEYVDKKLREVDPKGLLPPAKASVLASLAIAGELLQERSGNADGARDVLRRLRTLHDTLDGALGSE
jgi:cell division protein ZapA (FtsZ GTPase activity inhibitor)